MKIAIAASECTPFAKTGGLSDVIGSLPKALHAEGCEVRVFLPKYSVINDAQFEFHYEPCCGEMLIRVGGVVRAVRLLTTTLPHSDVKIHLIDCPHYFHRARIYTADWDEDERFILFQKAVIESLQRLKWIPDVIHCNDWQTGLLPLLLRDNYGWDSAFDKTATLFSIHNIAYQGQFSRQSGVKAELRSEHLDGGGLAEWSGGTNFMKTGIATAEVITTVSETYSREILTSAFGAGMEKVLHWRKHDLFGVLNGIDYDEWNPETDKHLPHPFSAKDLSGKMKCKEFLLEKTTMDFHPDVPLIGIISRFVGQKGFDLMQSEIRWLMEMNAQWVILGSGEDRYEDFFEWLSHEYPAKAWTYIGFNTELSHLIEAGADMFLMPSHYEPCGLNQMFSLRYGTAPMVRKTGGLADTVNDWHELSAAGNHNGNGFSFNDATGYALATTVERATRLFHEKPSWKQLQENGMMRDLSWNASAKKYIALYELALSKRRG
jgi:starch synthase